MGWSDLPKDIVDSIGDHLFSKLELLRVRSICKYWRSRVDCNKRLRNRKRLTLLPRYDGRTCFLIPTTFFRVTLSSYPNEGWLIKTEDVSELRKKLLSPLSCMFINSFDKTLDLLDFTVTEIHQSYYIEHDLVNSERLISTEFTKVLVVENLVFALDCNKKVWWYKRENTASTNRVWNRISNKEVKLLSDIIVLKGQIYALDLKGAIWWISLAELDIFQYGLPTPTIDYHYDVDDCKDKRLVEFGGDLCVVHQFSKKILEEGASRYVERTIGFMVYRMEKEMIEWVEVKSLGDKAFVMAKDCCFSVVASEYYECLENSIYFMENDKDVKVFKLGDWSITKMVKSSSSASCFQMFYPPFVRD